MNLRVPRAAPIIVGVLLLVVNGCGGSASTNVVGPSSTKCEISVTSNLTSVPAAGALPPDAQAVSPERPATAKESEHNVVTSRTKGVIDPGQRRL